MGGMFKLLLVLLLIVDSWWSSSCFSIGRTEFRRHRQLLFAEGAPKYQKQNGILQHSECVGEGSYLLHIDYDKINDNGDSEDSFEDGYYQPGHVLALEIQPRDKTTADAISDTKKGSDINMDSLSSSSSSSSSFTTMSEKTKRDLENNDGWLRGPYTVSRGYGSSSSNDDDNVHNAGFQVLMKEVGFKSHIFATSIPGTPVRFGGRFKVPIVEGIQMAAGNNSGDDNDYDSDEFDTTTKRVIMISTGAGVGPCIGAIETLLLVPNSNDDEIDVAIDLIASFRTRDEITMATDLDRLQKLSHSLGKKFNWKAVITEEVGRLSSSKPDILRQSYLKCSSDDNDNDNDDHNLCMIRNTHYHLIGNGQLVNEWKKGLTRAGIPTMRITSEAYFNHAAEPDATAINNICEAILLDDSERNNQMEGLATATAISSSSSSSVKQ